MSLRTGRVYKIITTQSNEIYIGSTFDTLKSKMFQLKNQYNQWKKNPTRRYSEAYHLFDKYGPTNCKIIEICNKPVFDRNHLEA